MFAVQCTDSVIRAAAAKRSGKNLSVHARAEQKCGANVFGNGIILNEEKALEALETLKSTLKLKRGSVVLCLSPRVVYTTLLRVPKVKGSTMEAAVRGELEAVLPEQIELMDIHFSPVRKDEQGMRIAVTAVSKSVVTGFKQMFAKAGLALRGITTTGLALGDMVHEDSFMLVNAEDPDPSIVVFYGGKPVDELLLSSVAVKSVIGDLNDLLAEFSNDGMPIMHIAIHGTKELAKKVEDAFTPKKKAEEKKEAISEAITVEHMLPNLQKADLEWGGIILSSLGKGYDVRTGGEHTGLQTALAVLFLAAAAYFVWTVGSVQILGFWSEILGL